MPRRTLVVTLAFAHAGLAQGQPEPQGGWYGTIVSEYTTTVEGKGELPLSSAALNVLSGSGRTHAFRRTRTTYTFKGDQIDAAYEIRSLKESDSVLRGRMACTLEDVGKRRARAIQAANRSSEREAGQASGPGECTFEQFNGGVNIACVSSAKGESKVDVSKSSGCSNCCDSPPGEHTEKSSPATSSSSEIDLPPVFVESRFEGPDVPESLVGSKYSESSDRLTHGTVSWVLAHKVEYDLEVTPAGYDTWRPKAGADELTRGNSLLVNATLKRKDGKKLDSPARKFVFTLVRRSSEPGVMMNWPPLAAIKPDEPDLRFDPDMNKPFKLKVGGDRGSEATTPEGNHETASAWVSSYDWGAYGVLAVEAVLPSGRRVLGHLVNDPDRFEILIPKRSGPDDPIAEVWRRQHDVVGIDARDDSDASPAGDDHPGDGLTLYEEYRGFRVNGKHLGTDPKKKDLFVVNEVGTQAAERGILLFRKASGLAIHLIREDEIDDYGINRNSSERFQNQSQHGVIVENAPREQTEYSDAEFPRMPGRTLFASMARNLLATHGLAQYAITLAHELGHTCWLKHHGDSDIGHARWELRPDGGVLELARGLVSTRGADGGAPIVLLLGDGSPPPAGANLDLPDERWWVGGPHGQHSGVDDCLMCYDAANSVQAYSRNDARYRLGDQEEQKMKSRFCSSSQGTGVNAPGGTFDHPRYGDAAPNRGNCTAHLCINDGRIAEHGGGN